MSWSPPDPPEFPSEKHPLGYYREKVEATCQKACLGLGSPFPPTAQTGTWRISYLFPGASDGRTRRFGHLDQ